MVYMEPFPLPLYITQRQAVAARLFAPQEDLGLLLLQSPYDYRLLEKLEKTVFLRESRKMLVLNGLDYNTYGIHLIAFLKCQKRLTF